MDVHLLWKENCCISFIYVHLSPWFRKSAYEHIWDRDCVIIKAMAQPTTGARLSETSSGKVGSVRYAYVILFHRTAFALINRKDHECIPTKAV